MFSWYVKREKYQNPPPGFSFPETVMRLVEGRTQARTPTPNPCKCFIPNSRHTWSLDPNVELPSMCMAISKAWQISPWPESVKTRQQGHKGWSHWVWRAFVGGFSYMVLPLGVKCWLPGSEKQWLGLILGFLQSWYHYSLKNRTCWAHIASVSCRGQVCCFRSV